MMGALLPLALLGFLGAISGPVGSDPLVLELFPGGPPGHLAVAVPRVEELRPAERTVAGRAVQRRENVGVPRLHVYLPPPEERHGSAVVVLPGGGFRSLAWDLEGTEVAEWLKRRGVVVAVLAYRVPTIDEERPWLAPVQDAQRALSLLRSRAGEWQLEASKIGVLGFSAGALAAARIALQPGARAYEARDEIDRSPCRPDFAVLVYPGGLLDPATRRLDRALTVAGEAPPCFLVQAADDPWRCENSTELYLALRTARVPAELHLYAAGGHGYGLRPQAELPVTTWPERCGEWLERGGWARGQR